jgi:hypothetical protein
VPRQRENSQLAGRFRRWWQVMGSNQRRLSRRFYRPLALHPESAALWRADGLPSPERQASRTGRLPYRGEAPRSSSQGARIPARPYSAWTAARGAVPRRCAARTRRLRRTEWLNDPFQTLARCGRLLARSFRATALPAGSQVRRLGGAPRATASDPRRCTGGEWLRRPQAQHVAHLGSVA